MPPFVAKIGHCCTFSCKNCKRGVVVNNKKNKRDNEKERERVIRQADWEREEWMKVDREENKRQE